jgi:hypothetical protein
LHLRYGFQCYRCKTVWLVEVTGSNADNATAWRETFGKLYWELSVTAIGCSAKGPGYWEISAHGCISAVAFNAVFGKLICFVEVTSSNANNAKAWRETVGVEMLGLLPQEIEPNMTIHQMGR